MGSGLGFFDGDDFGSGGGEVIDSKRRLIVSMESSGGG